MDNNAGYSIFNLSPTNIMKQSLAAHGTVLRNRNITPSSDHRPRNKLYTDWIESKYGKAGMPMLQPDSPGIASHFSSATRSK